MAGNKKLRNTINELLYANKVITADCQQLQQENQELRDRNELLESLIPQTNSPTKPRTNTTSRSDIAPPPKQSKREVQREGSMDSKSPNRRELRPIKGQHGTNNSPNRNKTMPDHEEQWNALNFARSKRVDSSRNYKDATSNQPSNVGRNKKEKYRTISANGVRDPHKEEVISALSTLILNRAAYNKARRRR